MELCQGKGSWGLGECSSSEGFQALKQAPESSGHQAAGVQEASGQCSQIYDLIFGWHCVEPGARISYSDPSGSLPTWNILQFYEVQFDVTWRVLSELLTLWQALYSH